MTEVPSDTSNWCSLPRNISLWLSGYKFQSLGSSCPGLETLAESYSVGHTLEEMSTEIQELAAENTLLKSKLGEGVTKAEVQSFLNTHLENQELKRKLAERDISEVSSANSEQISYELIQQQTQELKKLVDLPDTIAGDPENTQKNLKLLGVLSYYWENYTALLRTQMKDSLRSSQFSLFCLLASSKAEKELLNEAKEALSETDELILTDTYNLPKVFSCLDKLENLKLTFMQKQRQNKMLVDLKEPILKQRNLIQSCVNFLKDKKIEVSHKEATDWSAKSLLQGFQVQEKLMQSVFEVSKPLTVQLQQEKEIKLAYLERENKLLSALQEGKSVHMIDRSFQENFDIIRQLTNQNKELLSLLLENQPNSVPKILQKIHSETQELDNELESIQEEIETGQFSSCSPTHNLSVEKLANENYLLRKDLVEKEAKFVIFKQNNSGAKFEGKLKEKDKTIRELLQEKKDMSENIEKLKRNLHNLSVQARNNKTFKEQYRALNLMQSERENAIISMKQQMERQKLKTQAAVNETNKKKYGLIKTVNCLTQIVKNHDPSFDGFRGIEEMRVEAEEEISAYAHKIEGQLNKLTEKCYKLEEELAETQDTVQKQQDDINERIQIMQEVTEEVDMRNKKVALEKEVAKHLNNIDELKKEISDLKEELRILVLNKEEITQDNLAKDRKIQEMTQCLKDIGSEKAEVQEKLKESQAENQSLNNNLDGLRKEILSKTEQENNLMQEIETMKNEHQQKTSSIEQIVLEKDEKILDLENSLSQSNILIEELKADNKHPRTSKDKLETKNSRRNKHTASEELTPNRDGEESSKKELVKKKSSRRKSDETPEEEEKLESKKSLRKKESTRKKKSEIPEEDPSAIEPPTDKELAKKESKTELTKSKSSKKESSKTKKESSKKDKTGKMDESKLNDSPGEDKSNTSSPKKSSPKKESSKKESSKKDDQESAKKDEKKSKSKNEESKKTKKSEEGKEKSSRSKKSKA